MRLAVYHPKDIFNNSYEAIDLWIINKYPKAYPYDYGYKVRTNFKCPLLVVVTEEKLGYYDFIPLVSLLDGTAPKNVLKWKNKYINFVFCTDHKNRFDFNVNGYFTDEPTKTTVKL